MAIPKAVHGSQLSRIRGPGKAARQPPLENFKLSDGKTINYGIFQRILNRLAPRISHHTSKRSMAFEEWWAVTKANLEEYKLKVPINCRKRVWLRLLACSWRLLTRQFVDGPCIITMKCSRMLASSQKHIHPAVLATATTEPHPASVLQDVLM